MASLAEFFSQGVNLTGTFNPKIAVFLFLICLIGEATGFAVPLLLDTTWLLVGFHFSKTTLPFLDLVLLVSMALLGRQAGALLLYRLGASGSALLSRYKDRFRIKTDISQSRPFKLFRKLNLLSPFSVALGRLSWLRIPITLTLGAQRKLKVLVLGVVISSLIYDGAFITLGAVVGTRLMVKPFQMFLYFLAGLVVTYGVVFGIRRLWGLIARSTRAQT